MVKTQIPFEKELRDDKGRCYLIRIQPYRSRGRVDGAVMELFDVTQVKRSRSQLRKEIARLDAALNHCDALISIKNLEGQYLHASEAYANILETTADELVGKTDHELLPQEIADVIQATDMQAINDGALVVVPRPVMLTKRDQLFTATKLPIRDETGRIDAVTTRLTYTAANANEIDANTVNQNRNN